VVTGADGRDHGGVQPDGPQHAQVLGIAGTGHQQLVGDLLDELGHAGTDNLGQPARLAGIGGPLGAPAASRA
jgi:hypothetical protein